MILLSFVCRLVSVGTGVNRDSVPRLVLFSEWGGEYTHYSHLTLEMIVLIRIWVNHCRIQNRQFAPVGRALSQQRAAHYLSHLQDQCSIGKRVGKTMSSVYT